MSKIFLYAIGGIAIVLLAAQLVPYGHQHTNPPVVQTPVWNSPQTQAMVERACYDCHSNETVWPWYSNIAPVSWLIQHDVEEGRSVLNFSEWNRPQYGLEEVGEVVYNQEMPPSYYTILHPNAALTAAERSTFIQGLAATIGRQNIELNETGDAGK